MNSLTELAPALDRLHPAVSAWFVRTFGQPTEAQALAWPLIQAGESTLVAAPTGSGKTLTAFLAVIDELVRQGLAGELPDTTLVVYVSPLKALSNDIQINLQRPLAGIAEQLGALGAAMPTLRTAVRTGDTPQKDRARMRREAPHILVTTPESLYVLLGSASGRGMLGQVHTVIVDEIHAVAASKRGAHLALTLERLQALSGRALRRIGLSATQKPIERVAHLLAGDGRPCQIVDIGHARPRDLALELPPVPLGAVMANDVWELVYQRLADLARAHRTTLVFVNTRRLAERLARHLSDRLGQGAVAAHHGSLAREQRLSAEQRLKAGELQVLVATASLELGIDIGEVDLVCQVASPGSIAAFLQRVGRSGHFVGGTPKGRLFPTSRDDLIECVALLDCVRRGELDELKVSHAPLDVLAQQIVAEVSSQEWHEQALFDCLRRAMPYRGLDHAQYQALLNTLTGGYASAQGLRSAYLHRDAINGTLRGRRGSQLTAVTSGGTIPDNADYSVVLEPQGLNIGTVNEDFAVESIAGDVFQLGNTPYRILRVESGRVRVEDAKGQAPNIPFWLGEAPGRSDELSASVGRLQADIDLRLQAASGELGPVLVWLQQDKGLAADSAEQLLDYLARTRQALSALPSQHTLVMERFFDESGATQLIIHSPFGSRVNRAWGLALRKRFCRAFNFELQAAASEDAIVLSLSTSHSFELAEVWRYLNSQSAEHILIQAVLEAPLFGVRWRWNASTALALPRYSGGRKVAPQLQRMKSEDLIAQVFPDQIACLENLAGEREVPDHPLVNQTLDDCLHEALDAESWLALLRRIEQGQVRLVCRDLPAPSPLAAAILNARPYAFLDDAPVEERRTQAVLARRWSDPQSADDLGLLDAEAIEAVAAEAWPAPRNTDEMHEALMSLGAVTQAEAGAHAQWATWLRALATQGRAARMDFTDGHGLWFATERLMAMRAVYPQVPVASHLNALPGFDQPEDPDHALLELVRGRLGGAGPLRLEELAEPLRVPGNHLEQALARLETEGYVLRGQFRPGIPHTQWCERHLLARIHRYTVKRLRREIEPVSLQTFMRFAFQWQHLAPASRLQGAQALGEVLALLEGYSAAAGGWEQELLAPRLKGYSGTWLDEACRQGRAAWLRPGAAGKAGTTLRGSAILLLPRAQAGFWRALSASSEPAELSARTARVVEALRAQGALFFDELQGEARLLPTELENALQEAVAAGQVTADSFAGLRALITPAGRRQARSPRRGRGAYIGGMDDAGRWALVRAPASELSEEEKAETVARTLLRRYGVVFWRLLEREASWLPSWRVLLRTLHRLEARGEIRGGRFVDGLAGEQFALPEAIPLLRQLRKQPESGELVCISALDPLNQAGTLLPGIKVPAVPGNRLVFRDGLLVATRTAGKAHYLQAEEPAVRDLLIRDAGP